MDANLIKYLQYRIESLEQRNEFLNQQLNHCLGQLDLQDETI